jgi:Mn-dependent DtxR family transcriptional regulator
MVHRGGLQLTPTHERYLEAIFRLQKNIGVVRVTDLAVELGLKKGTVSGTLKVLKKQKVIDYAPYRPIALTAQGRRSAEKIDRRNRIVERFLVQALQIDPEISITAARRIGAAVDGCVLEHMLRWLNQNLYQGVEIHP